MLEVHQAQAARAVDLNLGVLALSSPICVLSLRHRSCAQRAERSRKRLMARRICPCTGCPAHSGSCPSIVTAGRCPACRTTADTARGTRQQRGYDANHDAERRRWSRLIRRQPQPCARGCGRLIHDGDTWDLDHADDRQSYLGPSCPACNRAAGGRAAHLQ